MTTRPYGMSKYQHAAAVLRSEIQDGKHAPGQPLPSETRLIERFGYDRSTIRKALARLRQEGLVISEQGRGVYVRQTRTVRHELVQVLRSEHEYVKSGRTPPRGLFELNTGARDDATEVFHEYETVSADDDLADAFKVEPGTELLRRRYLFVYNSKPHQRTDSYLPYDMVRGTHLVDPDNERAGQGTELQLHSIGVPITFVSADINARMPSPDETTELQIPEGTPLIVQQTRSLSDGRCVAVSNEFRPADRATIGVDVDLERG